LETASEFGHTIIAPSGKQERKGHLKGKEEKSEKDAYLSGGKTRARVGFDCEPNAKGGDLEKGNLDHLPAAF